MNDFDTLRVTNCKKTIFVELLDRAVLLLFLAFFALACSPRPKPSESAQVFKAYVGPEASNLDWHTTRDIISMGVIYNLMDGLFDYDLSKQQLTLKPQLVRTYRHSREFRTWVFELRTDVQWNDGEPLKAQHFVDAWQRLFDSATNSPHAFRLKIIKSYKATGDHQLQVELKKSMPRFPRMLTGFFTFPYRKDKPDVTLGAYQLSKKTPQELCVTANKTYYLGSPEVKDICFVWLEDADTALKLFRKGELQLVRSPNWKDLSKEEQSESYRWVRSLSTYFLSFNFRNSPGNDLAFRKSVQAAIDPVALAKLAENDLEVTNRYIPEFILPNDQTRSGEKSKPQEIFLKKPLILASNSSVFNRKLMSFVDFQLRSKLKIKPEVRLLDNATYYGGLKQGLDFDIYRLSWAPALYTPHGFLRIFHSDAPQNYGGYADKNYDKMLEKAFGEGDSKKQADLYRAIEEKLIEQDVVLIPLFNPRSGFLIKEKGYNLQPHPTQRLDFQFLKRVD